MTEPTEKIATLQSEVKTLTEAVRELTVSMQKNNERLERLAVLEVSHRNSDQAIGRAFEALKAHEIEAERMHAANEAAHKSYDKAIWSALGFSAAVTVFWTIFGVGAKNTIEDVAKTVAEMKVHVVQDKVLTENDVYKIHREQK